jgi:catechol 2,3-dioxygenase-like lactoylglutathione lyase family enzyme
MSLVLSLDHINIRTADLAGTRAFFTDVLGLQEGARPPFPFPGAWLYAGGKDVVHLIEINSALGPSDASSLDHFAFAISDYDEARRRVAATGLKFYELGVPGAAVRQIFVTDLNGVSIELNAKS